MAPSRIYCKLVALFLLRIVHAVPSPWIITEYHEIIESLNTFTEIDTFVMTESLDITVSPTGPVTPYKTVTQIVPGQEEYTAIELYLPTDALVAPQEPTACAIEYPEYNLVCSDSTTTSIGTVTITNYFAAMTVVNAACTSTISYETQALVAVPTEVLPADISITSSTTYLTSSSADYNGYGYPASVKTAFTWTAIDYYLQTGQVTPTMNQNDQNLLSECLDPRGCYSGYGEGCTATGAARATEVNGPVGSKGAANRVSVGTAWGGLGGSILVIYVLVLGAIGGGMLIL